MASTVVLMALVLVSLILAFVGGGFAEDLLGFLGLGSTAVRSWNIARWPGAVLVAMLVFSFIYYVTPDVQHRSLRWVTPGAVVGVLLWLAASAASRPTSRRSRTSARSTARSPGASCSSAGSGSPTSRCCSARSSTPRSSASASGSRVTAGVAEGRAAARRHARLEWSLTSSTLRSS